jgi:arabinose-5-phosphate isomerase
MNNNYINQAKEIIKLEMMALKVMCERVDVAFDRAVEIILETRGRVVVIGMGKSGIVGQKIAATLASTGTPSFFVHPGEAFHGDLGMIKPIDVAVLISNSGETEEILRLLPFLKHQQNRIIALTGKLESTLAKYADAVLNCRRRA